MNNRYKAYFYLLIVSIIWGVASPVIKFTLAGIAVLPFLVYRFGISSVATLFSGLIRGFKIPKKPSTLFLFILYGFMTTTVSLGLLFLGMEKTTVLDSSLISTIAPLLIVAAGSMFLKERVTGREKIGISIALLGTIVTTIEPLISNGRNFIAFSGNLLIIGYLLANTVSAVLAKKLTRDNVDEAELSNFSFVIGFISLAPFAISKYGFSNLVHTITTLDFSYQLGVFYMALLSGTLAYFLWVKGQKTIEIGEAGLFSYLYPIFSAPLAIFWLKEKIDPVFIIGAILILIGVVIAEIKKKR